MADDTIRYALLAALAIALVTAACTDLAHRRIANWLNAAIALGAPLFWLASGLDLWPGVALQLGIALATFALLLGLFALRAMGGGDVKLLTALALWIAPALYLKLIVLMALLGGALTLALGFWHIVRRRKDSVTVPYGVAIALAGLWVIGVDYLPGPDTPGVLG
jgi:prepilin peptidase CpaA